MKNFILIIVFFLLITLVSCKDKIVDNETNDNNQTEETNNNDNQDENNTSEENNDKTQTSEVTELPWL